MEIVCGDNLMFYTIYIYCHKGGIRNVLSCESLVYLELVSVPQVV